MKSEKGITLTSVVIYIVLVIASIAILSTIRISLQSNINEVNKEGIKNYEIDKFNMYFLEEVKKQDNEVVSINNDGTIITFKTGNIYMFESDSIKLIEGDNNIIISRNIEQCEFSKIFMDGKEIIRVVIKIDNGETKTIEYVLNSDNTTYNYESEDEYSSNNNI